MKELTIEQKAKAYDKALEKANAAYKDEDKHLKATLERIFPELKESKDNKIRKELIRAFKSLNTIKVWNGIERTDILAWLEKQAEQKPNPYTGTSFEYNGHIWGMCARDRDNGVEILFDGELKAFLSLEKSFIYPINSQPYLAPKFAMEAIKEEKVDNQNCVKPADKVEPKFKVGDWLIFNERHNGIYQVERIDDYRYYLRHYLGGTMSVHFDNELIRLWTLQDAKSGDVLSNGKMIVIFKHFEEPSYRQHIVAYIGLDRGGDIQITDDTWRLGIDKTKPATKEQRELLFQKMKEAGYTFDFEKKELKRIEQKPAEDSAKVSESSTEEKDMDEYKKGFECGKQRVLKYPEDFGLCKKSAWSEEDEKFTKWSINNLTELKDKYGEKYGNVGKCIDWIKSLEQKNKRMKL